jgi:hypothetical protein
MICSSFFSVKSHLKIPELCTLITARNVAIVASLSDSKLFLKVQVLSGSAQNRISIVENERI